MDWAFRLSNGLRDISGRLTKILEKVRSIYGGLWIRFHVRSCTDLAPSFSKSSWVLSHKTSISSLIYSIHTYNAYTQQSVNRKGAKGRCQNQSRPTSWTLPLLSTKTFTSESTTLTNHEDISHRVRWFPWTIPCPKTAWGFVASSGPNRSNRCSDSKRLEEPSKCNSYQGGFVWTAWSGCDEGLRCR